jgi:hypothetical protein
VEKLRKVYAEIEDCGKQENRTKFWLEKCINPYVKEISKAV